MILSWICLTLSPRIAKSTVYIDIAKNLWKDLKERLFKGDHLRILYLFQEIHSIKQEDERNVTQFFMNLKIILEEIETEKLCNKPCTTPYMSNLKDLFESKDILSSLIY